MTFDDALKSSGLADALTMASRPMLTKEAADFAIEVAKHEPVKTAVLSFTHLCEASFAMHLKPQVNGKPGSPWNFDVGPMQLSVEWTAREVFDGDFSSAGLKWKECFGDFFESDGVTTRVFNGNPIANGRAAAKHLLAIHGDWKALGFDSLEQMQTVKYTGPEHQSRRLELYRLLMPAFSAFYDLYKGEVT